MDFSMDIEEAMEYAHKQINQSELTHDEKLKRFYSNFKENAFFCYFTLKSQQDLPEDIVRYIMFTILKVFLR